MKLEINTAKRLLRTTTTPIYCDYKFEGVLYRGRVSGIGFKFVKLLYEVIKLSWVISFDDGKSL